MTKTLVRAAGRERAATALVDRWTRRPAVANTWLMACNPLYAELVMALRKRGWWLNGFARVWSRGGREWDATAK